MVERIKRKKSSYLPLLENSSPTASPGGGENAAGDLKKTEREETIESIINAFSLPHRNEFYMSHYSIGLEHGRPGMDSPVRDQDGTKNRYHFFIKL